MTEEKIDIRTYIAIVLRRKWLILILFLVTFLSTIYFTLRKPPVYEAKATIIIKQLPTTFPGMELGFTKATYITNHTLILKSRTLMEKVAENFSDVEMESVGVESKGLIIGKVSLATTINPVRNSDIIEIKCKADKPYTAALFANKVAETYIQFNIEDKRREVSGVRVFAESQKKVVESQLKEAEDKIRNYQKKHKVLGLKKETEEFIIQLAELQTLYEKAKIERRAVEKNLDAVKSQLTLEQKEFLETSTDISLPLFADLKKSLSTLENDRASLLIQGYTADEPKIKEIESKIEAIKQKMNEIIVLILRNRGQIDALSQVQNLLLQSLRLQIEIEVAKAKEKAYRGILNQYEGRFKLIPDSQIELARLERQRTSNEKIYMMLVEKAEEAKISEASEIGTVSMLDRARIPEKQIWKKRILNIILGFIMGLIISMGVAFVIEYFDTS
ncbi:GumC family protein, partial [candidate division WOR-3 bacterium]|nr:GumC family protein [candidate division WOR-3 bacterium]